jgi:hypothetical protein
MAQENVPVRNEFIITPPKGKRVLSPTRGRDSEKLMRNEMGTREEA